QETVDATLCGHLLLPRSFRVATCPPRRPVVSSGQWTARMSALVTLRFLAGRSGHALACAPKPAITLGEELWLTCRRQTSRAASSPPTFLPPPPSCGTDPQAAPSNATVRLWPAGHF